MWDNKVDLILSYLKVIHLPKTPEDLAAVTHGFAGLARHRAFGKAAGAIDGCHVRIKPPSGPDGHCYRNRKLFSSIILQAVCDHQGRFIDTYVGWPGSVHDSRVLRHSPLYRSLYPPPGHFILADGGYPCLQHPLPLITPYKRPVRGVGAQRFNWHHSRARSIIERAFGMMKTRFRAIFLQALEVHHTFVPHVSNHSTGFFRILRVNQKNIYYFLRRYISFFHFFSLPFQVITACAILRILLLWGR